MFLPSLGLPIDAKSFWALRQALVGGRSGTHHVRASSISCDGVYLRYNMCARIPVSWLQGCRALRQLARERHSGKATQKREQGSDGPETPEYPYLAAQTTYQLIW